MSSAWAWRAHTVAPFVRRHRGCPPPGTASGPSTGTAPGATQCGAGTFPARSCGRSGTRGQTGLGVRDGGDRGAVSEQCATRGEHKARRGHTDGLLLRDRRDDDAGVGVGQLLVQPHKVVEPALDRRRGALVLGRRRLRSGASAHALAAAPSGVGARSRGRAPTLVWIVYTMNAFMLLSPFLA